MDILKLWLFNTNTNEYEFESDGTLDGLFETIKGIEPNDSRWVITTARNHVICSGVIPVEWSSTILS